MDILLETKAGLEKLKKLVIVAESNGQCVCITCFERDARHCHRSVLIEFMKRRLQKLEVVHL